MPKKDDTDKTVESFNGGDTKNVGDVVPSRRDVNIDDIHYRPLGRVIPIDTSNNGSGTKGQGSKDAAKGGT